MLRRTYRRVGRPGSTEGSVGLWWSVTSLLNAACWRVNCQDMKSLTGRGGANVEHASALNGPRTGVNCVELHHGDLREVCLPRSCVLNTERKLIVGTASGSGAVRMMKVWPFGAALRGEASNRLM